MLKVGGIDFFILIYLCKCDSKCDDVAHDVNKWELGDWSSS